MARQLKRVSATFTRPSNGTQYTAGDEVSSSATAGSVVLPKFDIGAGFRKALIKKASMSYTIDDSTTVVIAAADFDLTVFKTTDAPAAVGDNVALDLSGVVRGKGARFSFVNTAWTNSLGALTAGKSAFQEVLPKVSVYNGAELEFTGADKQDFSLTGVVQAIGVWNPSTAANVFTIWLDLEVEP